MILIGLGSNLSGPWGTPRETVARALLELNQFPTQVRVASELVITKPFGVLNQPDFVNAVAVIETALPPDALLRRLHQIERRAGRKRKRRWGPRSLDLDILVYHDVLRKMQLRNLRSLVLPHPGIPEREFVLRPLAEIAPRWKHPVLHKSAAEILRKPSSLKAI